MKIDLSKLEKTKTKTDVEKEQASLVATQYLASTDWYVIRKVETGEEIPEQIKTLRNQARKDVIYK